jgi:hypothetical protein
MRVIPASLVLFIAAVIGPPAAAQSLGTFAWQLEPYCNLVRFTVTPDGAAFRLSGFDDQCGSGKAPAAGVLTPNGDGTFTLAFYLITPNGQAGHTTAVLAPGSYSGHWKDDAGLSGTARFGPPGPPSGGPRPLGEFQRRVTGLCTGSEFVQKVREDGSVECAAAAPSGGGDITGVAAGAGLVGGGADGEVTLGIAPGGVGSQQISDGAVGALDIDSTAVQRRVTGTCAAGEFVRLVHQNGSVTCGAATNNSGGDITAVYAGTGLAGGGTNGDVTLGIAPGGVGSLQIADGGIAAADVNAAQIQLRVAGSCPKGSFLIGLQANGAPICSPGDGGMETALGHLALNRNTLGFANTALGHGALASNTIGNNNTGVGVNALTASTSGSHNTAFGGDALASNSLGNENTAIGTLALSDNVNGHRNTGLGVTALTFTQNGSHNVGLGWAALGRNVSGSFNTAVGSRALEDSLQLDNTAVGFEAARNVNQGSRNVAVGSGALPDVTSGSGNIAIGYLAGADLMTGSDNIHIGYQGAADESDTIRIGVAQNRAFIQGIRGTTTGGAAVAVLVDLAGQLGTVSSSRRTKEDIEDMRAASAGIFRLRPVTFRYIQPYADGSKPLDYGLIAEEVDEVYPDLVVRNEAGEIETVQYHKLVPMLLNELQRLRREVDALSRDPKPPAAAR